MVPGCPGTSKKISTLVLVHIVRSVFLLLGLLAWFPTRPCAAQIYSTVPYKPVKNSLVPFVYTCTAYLFFGLYTSTLCEVLCEVPFLSCDLLLCVGDGGGGVWFALQPDREPLQKPDGLRPCLAAWNLQLCRHSCPNFAPRMLYDKTEAHETLMYLKTTVNVPKDYCKSFSKTKSAVEYYSQMRRRCYLVLDGGLLFFFRQKGHQLYHMRITVYAGRH